MIIVFGSLNMDMAIKLDRLPVAGETVLSEGYDLFPGGKGANQALAAARAGAKVALVGKVGDDSYGRILTESLKRDGVMVSGVGKSNDKPTGTAVVVRDSQGENQIIVLSGANVEVMSDQVPDEILTSDNVLMMQMELLPDETFSLMERAHARGVKTILNLAPAVTIPKRALGHLDYLIVNSIEARQIAEKLNLPVENNALRLAHGLAVAGQMTCIVTLGSKGSVAVTKEGEAWGVGVMPVEPGQIKDITGAGDTWCGTFAAAIHAGLSLPDAMRRASVAGTLATFKEGAQPSMPYLDDVEENLDKLAPATKLAL